MTFEEYCVKKKIDPELFRQNDHLRFTELSAIFDQISPESFTQQKKFLINDLRRRFPYAEKATANSEISANSEVKKPAVKIAPKIRKAE